MLVALVLTAPIGAALAALQTGAWQTTAAPAVLRSGDHTATLLKDGRVLVVGGASCGAACNFRDSGVTAAEIYQPGGGRWTATGATTVPRQYHTATLLGDGRVVVTGGYVPAAGRVAPDITGATEVYTPSTGSWSMAAPMRTGRIGHTATLLRTGEVLVAGGITLKPTETGSRLPDWDDSAELFDPAKGTWHDAGRMGFARAEHTATLLDNGTVLVAGGRNAVGGRPPLSIVTSLAAAELYDPAAGTWRPVPHLMRSPRAAHTATSLADGSVLLAGGAVSFDHGGTSHPTASAELYHPATHTFTPIAPMPAPRLAQTATALPDGRILVAGGIGEGEDVRNARRSGAPPELYDPATGSWAAAAPAPADPTTHGARQLLEFLLAGHHTATLLPGGEVLVIGGDAGSRSAQLFSPAGPTPETGRTATGRALVALVVAAVAAGALAFGWELRRRRRRRTLG